LVGSGVTGVITGVRPQQAVAQDSLLITNEGQEIRLGVKATLYTLLECSGARSCNHKFHKTGEVSSTKIMMGRCRDGEMG